MTFEELQKKHEELSARTDDNFQEAIRIANETKRVEKVCEDTPKILKELDQEFAAITKLDPKDISFLFVATALQIVRQYTSPLCSRV